VQIIPQRITIIGSITSAPTRFKSRFIGSSVRMYGILSDDQSKIIEEVGNRPLSYGQCHRELVVRHVEALRESGNSSITDIPFVLSDKRINYCRETYDLSWNHFAVVETSKGTIAGALTKNDKRSGGEMSTEK
jgi:hypothetical protein